MDGRRTAEQLRFMQAAPLSLKIALSRDRIRQWINTFGESGCYVSFSGGKDSTVLLHLVRNVCGYRRVPAVFADVPTQYPELKAFAQKYDNLTILKPKISFMQVCDKYGFPLISKEVAHKMSDWESAQRNGHKSYVDAQFEGNYKSKNGKKNMFGMTRWKFLREAPFSISHQCCNVMKKEPFAAYSKETGRLPMTAQMAEESLLRTQTWVQHGCNMFDAKHPKSNPLSFWTEQDILQYIVENDLEICSVYGDIVEDYSKSGQCDGQMSLADCGLQTPNNLQAERKPLKCTGCQRTGCMLCGFGCHIERESRFQKLHKSHPKMYNLLDVVKNNGITFRQAIEWTNEHGNLNIRL